MVTGSRIAHALNDTLQPTVEVSGAAFDERGYTNVSQALDELPEFGVPPTSQQNQQSAFSVGQSFVDLFSLGSQRTLTLVDGRRFVSSNTASLAGAASPGSQVDFNVIPVQLIDHIETVTVGGAPQYGADAIAGTVNVILKHDYQGLDIQAQSGVSNEGDAWNYRLSALGGHNFADGRGNITIVIEYNKSTGLRGTSRSDFVDQGGFEAPATPGKYSEIWYPQGAVNQLSTSGVPYLDNFFYTPGVPDAAIGIVNSAGQPLAFSPGSNALTPYNLGTETGNPIFYNGGAGINLINYSNLQAWTGRLNADTLGHFDWTDHVQTFWEGWLSEDHSHSLISQPLYEATIFGNPGGVQRPAIHQHHQSLPLGGRPAAHPERVECLRSRRLPAQRRLSFRPELEQQILLPRSRQHRPGGRRLHGRSAGRPRRRRPEGRLLHVQPGPITGTAR